MPDFHIENNLQGIVAGVDEVGRGPWAGPVTACAAIINRQELPSAILNLIDDSKKLKKKDREGAYTLLTNLPVKQFCYSLGYASVEEIDRINIRQAALLAMTRAIEGLTIKPDHCLIDGNALPTIAMPATCVIGGDDKSLSIAAASIIAKVERDRLMLELSKDFPEYGWESNAGYGTKVHQQAINDYGVCIHHRRSFKPIMQQLQLRLNN